MRWRWAAMWLMMPVLLTGCKSGDPAASVMSLRGRPAPDFTLKDLEDQSITLSAYRGHPIILSFWAIGCPPCVAEAPQLSVIAREHEVNGLLVFAVNAWDEPHNEIARFARQKRLKQYMLLDGGRVFRQYGLSSVPTVLFINPEGVIVDAEVGFDGPGSLRQKTKALLGK